MVSAKPFDPTLSDVLVVRALLTRHFVPPELARTILDYAEYWVRSSTKVKAGFTVQAYKVGQGETDYQGMNLLLRSFPVGITENAVQFHNGMETEREFPYETAEIRASPVTKEYDREFFQGLISNSPVHSNPVRKIVFRIRSCDQGWTTDERQGLFNGSKTWFEAGIERFNSDHECDGCSNIKELPLCKLAVVEPGIKKAFLLSGIDGYRYEYSDWKNSREIQRNKMACSEWQKYEVTWTCWDIVDPDSKEAEEGMAKGKGRMDGDGRFVRSLKLGDVVTVWARAMHRGWVTRVDTVEMDIYWAL